MPQGEPEFNGVAPDDGDYEATVPMSEVTSDEDAEEGTYETERSSSVDVLGEDELEGKLWWSSGLFDCHLDLGGCLHGCCCFCCAVARAKTAFNETPFLLNLLCSLASPCVAHLYLRHQVRVGFELHGDICRDCLISAFCAPCSVCQVQRQLDEQGGGITCGGPVMENVMGAVY